LNISLEYPAAWLLLLVPIALGLATWLYFFREGRRHWSKRWRVLLAGLRFSWLFLILFLLLKPFLVKQVEDLEKPLLLLFEDRSASINVDEAKEVSTVYAEYQEAFSEQYDVRVVPFAEQVSTTGGDALNGLNTDIGAVFDFVNQSFQGANVGALVVASDGMLNQGRDPRYANLETEAPLFSLMLGDTSLKPDLSITKVRANNLAFLGNDFEVRGTLQASKMEGAATTVRLLRNGKEVAKQAVKVDAEQFTQAVSFIVPASAVGVARYGIALDSLDSERNTSNNIAETYVEVLDNRTQVILLAHAPHPDIAALKLAIEKSDQYEVKVVLFDEWTGRSDEGDLFITHGLPRGNEDLSRLQPLVDIGKPFFAVVTGDVSLAHFNALNLGLRITTTRNQRDQAGAYIDQDFGLFNVPENDELKRYPPLMVPFGEMKFTANAQVALKQRVGGIQTEQPFLVFTEQDGNKHGVLLAEGWWRWRLFNRMMDEEEWTDAIIQKSVQYLAVRQKRTRLAVSVPDRFIEGEAVIFQAEYYNEAFELTTDVPIALTLVDGDSNAFEYKFSPQVKDYKLNLGTLAPGDYDWTARVEGQEEAFEQKGVFKVLENRVEYQSSVANHALMRYLAEQHGGDSYDLSEQEALRTRLSALESAKPIIHSSSEWISLIDWKTLLFIIVVLAGLEWLLRKTNGYV
jgi:hypothetical protein